jgi:hypothetical protein
LKRCILKGVEITEQNDSKAHVIPSALGGRLKPKGILCDVANTELGDKFDGELVKAYHQFMVLVDGSRDKGGDLAPFKAQSASGKPYSVTPDEVKLGAPEYIKTVLPDGKIQVTVKARTMKEARTLLGRAKSDFPNLQTDIDTLMQSARVEHVPVEALNFAMQFGPISTFPAAFVMASVYCAVNELPPHPEFVNYVDKFDVANRSMPPDTFYFMHEDTWFSHTAEVGHSVILFGDAKSKQAIFFMQLFNQPGIAVLLPYAGNDNVCFSYGVDVLLGQEVEVDVDQAKLAVLDWSETHKNGDEALWREVEKRSTPLLAIASKRSLSSATDEIFRKHFGKNNGELITEADVKDASQEIAALLMRGFQPDKEDWISDQ